jgi:hypothetical protein
VAEYALAAVLVAIALHARGSSRVVLLAAASLVAGAAALTDGPLGGWRLLDRRSHRVADRAIPPVVALLAAVPGRGLPAVLALLGAALGLRRLAAITRYQRRAPLRLRTRTGCAQGPDAAGS